MVCPAENTLAGSKPRIGIFCAVAHDPMGNRSSYNNVNQAYSYTSNNLNQYTAIFNPDGSAQNPAYDENGNSLEANGYVLAWDDENRLIAATKANNQKLELLYDGLGRRRIKKVYSWTGSAWQLDKELHFIYNGWNMICETTLNNLQQVINIDYNIQGLDLSGSEQGAGGVGGFLCVKRNSSSYLPTYDGNGNVTAYVDTSSNASVASYTYSPFGKIVSQSGSLADSFNVRFSTKYQDLETGLLYYGFRYYSPDLGRWLNRDPIGEIGFINAFVKEEYHNIEMFYGFVLNNPISKIDKNGLIGVPVVLVAAAGTCLYFNFQAALKKYPSDEAMRHCYASCTSARTCSSAVSLIAGVGFEIITDIWGRLVPGMTPDLVNALYDLANNYTGLACAGKENIIPGVGLVTMWFRKGCDCCCKEALK